MTSPTAPTSSRNKNSTSGLALAVSLEMTYWVPSPMAMKIARKMTETMPMILLLNLLVNDLLFTRYRLGLVLNCKNKKRLGEKQNSG
jgi:hypothetical protein